MVTHSKFQPLADRILVEPLPAEEKTAHGLIIPNTAQEKPQKGTVKAVGPGTKEAPMLLKAGDQVLYGKFSGQEIKLDHQTFLVMRQSDVLGKLI